MSGVRAVVAEEERIPWTLEPLKAVGPLRFGMTHDDVVTALDGLMRTCSQQGGYGYGPVVSAEYSLDQWASAPAVSCYYDEDGSLGCVAVNALRGPQVTLDGIRLVGRVPSELDHAFDEHLAGHGYPLRCSQHGDLASQDLGVILRAQRAGDVVLSRPVFVAAA